VISSRVPPNPARFSKCAAARSSQRAFGKKDSTLIEQQLVD
jgi:hypothetical protein